MSTVDFPTLRIRVLAAAAPPAWPAWRVGMAVGAWKELPGTGLSSVEPVPAPPGNTVFGGKISENGLAIRKADSCLIRFGGGHADYAGNEVDACVLSVDAPAWQQVSAPTPTAEIASDQSWWGTVPNQKPNPPHTYHQMQFIDGDDMLYLCGRHFTYINGKSFTEMVGFDWTTKKWLAQGTLGAVPMWTTAGFPNVCKDATGEGIYLLSRVQDTVYHWTRATRTWTSVAKTNHVNNGGNIALDTVRNRLLRYGWLANSTVPTRTIDLTTGAGQDRTLTGDAGILTALSALVARERPAMTYDAALDLYLVHSGVAGTVHTIHPETFVVGTLATSNGAAVPNSHSKGPCSRFVHAPNLGGYAYLPAYTSNVWFLAME